ncbi:Protein of unknown function precursor. Putative carbohydrate binding protein [Tenacibaculum jejuense]|uniref:LamG-like jellyroll fold domain-containing protein n=2 Tax=Tenacibaculum jejuense TaxID=584609 RepID=A0A238U7Y3_9FLAO|nr:Protein of unknown function precursor. Putative carbohydrate binding protein [Tenacibaculum jejuense]
MMKKLLITAQSCCWIILLCFFLNTHLIAQTANENISVLKMPSSSGHISNFDTNVGLKSMLLDKGNLGEATIEFWTKFKNDSESLLFTTDALNNKGFTFKIHRNNVILNSDYLNDQQPIDIPATITGTFWQHYAFTFYQLGPNSFNIDLHVDGYKVKTFSAIEIADNYDLYFTKGGANQEIFLAEVKAWNVKRQEEQIFNNRYTSFYNYTGNIINDQINKGLVANFSGDAEEQPTNQYMPELTSTHWLNTIQQDGYPAYGKIASKLTSNSSNKTLAFINSEIENPISQLDQIIVSASKGAFSDKVELKWFHVADLTYYNIYRDGSKIGTEDNITKNSGEQLFFTDKGALPGTIYTYTIVGDNTDAPNPKSGSNTGFIFPNGTLTGVVKTQSEVYVKDVAIEINLNEPDPSNTDAVNAYTAANGSALEFAANSPKISFVESKLITDNNNITIEFWYKNGTTTGRGTNKVFQSGNTSIAINTSSNTDVSTSIQFNNNIVKTFPLGANDTEWHHYVYAFGNDGINVYKDEVLVGTDTTAFDWSSTSNDYNFYINQAAAHTYLVDEFRVWKGKKNLDEIEKYATYIADSDEENLLLAYSMDLNDTKAIYNRASVSQGSYVGKIEQTSNLVYKEQPKALKYVAYTDANGSYEFSAIYSTHDKYTYTSRATKPIHEFKPSTVGAIIKQSSLPSDYSKVANFTDISNLPVAGRIFYVEGENKYPVPAGRRLAIDGQPLLGSADGLLSNKDGVYSVSSSLGLHTFEVFNPELTNNNSLNSLDFSPVEADNTITSGGYAVTKNTINYKDNGITISGFVKPFVSVTYPSFVPEKQTLLQWNQLEVVLKNNTLIQVFYNDQLQKEAALNNPSSFSFFAVSIADTGELGLLVNGTYKSGMISAPTFNNDWLYIGASTDNGGTATASNLSPMTLVEFRNTSYTEAELKAIKSGDIIDGDADHLELSFDFAQEKGNRALSKTVAGKDNYLVLNDAATISNSEIITYSKKYKYEYVATTARYNPQAGSHLYSLNVIDPMTEVDFEMKDRFGFVGNIVIPCENTIGAWTGTITRTDSDATPAFSKEITASNFDNENKVFMIDGLIPGKYEVIITNVNDTTITRSISNIDITKGWATYDFEYRAPLSIELNAYQVKEDKITTPLEDLVESDFDLLEKACGKDFYVFSEGAPVLLQATVFEQYGDQKCMIEEATVNFTGGLFKLADGATSAQGKTDANGHAVLASFAATPNFMAPHTKGFTIQAMKNESSKIETLKGLITGARMNNSDFTIADPVINYVLHDPPGDGSSATLKKGTKSVTTGKWNAALGYTGTLSNQLGLEHRQNLVATVLGFGTSITAFKAEVSTGVDVQFSALGTYNGSTVTETENTEEFSTSSSESIVGKEADLFIGTGYLITVGSGETLAYDSDACEVQYSSNAQVLNNKIDNSFSHTYYDIKKDMIPNLLEAIANETDDKKIKSYENSVIKWSAALINNDFALNLYKRSDYAYLKDHAFLSELDQKLDEYDESKYDWNDYKQFKNFDKNRSFDGGGSVYTRNITTADTDTNGADFQSTFDFGYKTQVDGTVAGVSSKFEYTNTVNTALGGGFEITDETNTLVQYTLTDGDAGDRFALEIRRDPNYGVPIFKTLAGKSSCPAERGTQIRTGVEISSEKTIANGLAGQTLEYQVKLRNTQTAGNADSPKTYELSLSTETNPLGAIVTVGGKKLNGNTISYWFGPDDTSPTGIKQEYDVTVQVTMPDNETDSYVEYKDLELLFAVPCEGHTDLDYDHNISVYEDAGVKSIDALYLTAQFHGPCIKETIMNSPQENWVINQSNNNIQDFIFTLSGVSIENDEVVLPGSLTAVEIEYALADNNTPILLKTITAEELKNMYSDTHNAFKASVDVSGLVNGGYGFRIVPVCGLGTEVWRRNTPTPYVYGNVSRTAPLLLETSPIEGGILTDGAITAVYNKPLDPTTLTSLNISLRGTLGGLPKKLISAEFNGPTDIITVPHGDFLNLSGAFTTEFWINPTAYPVNGIVNLFEKGNNYSLGLNANGKLVYKEGLGGNTTASLPLHEWTHVAMVYDGYNNINFYFNGVLVYSDVGYNVSNENIQLNTDDLIIGGSNDQNEGYLGLIDELRIWNKARSHGQIVSFKDKQLLGNEDQLMAYYVFDNIALEVDGFQEGVRDFTGNTSGSTQNGISWIEGDFAAPLSIEQLIQDIPIEVNTNVDNNEIIITPLNFQEYFLEGAKLTAILSNNSIKGVDGNITEGHSWSFTINKNNTSWNKANINASQQVGNTTSFSATLTNNGGTDTTFELQSLPDWLKCTNVTVGDEITIEAGFEKTLNFSTSAYLNKGVFYDNIGVITYSETGTRTGYEYFKLTLDVNCETPDYEFNASNFPFKKEFTGTLNIAGEISEDTNDVIVAYFNNEVRGKGSVSMINNKPTVLLDVFYNVGESGDLYFHVWDDSHCKEYIGLQQTYAIGDTPSEGNIITPVLFETGDTIVKRIPLLQGYQWVSFNSINNPQTSILDVNRIKGMEEGDQIMELSGNEITSFSATGEASGTLQQLDYTKGYQVKSASDKLMLIQGTDAPMNTNISVNGGYATNYVGYIPNVMFNTSYALRSLSNKFSIGDKVSGREGFSEFTAEGWKGTLTHLIPNKSYSIKMLNPGTLNYSGVVTTSNNVASRTMSFDDVTSENTDKNALDTKYLKDAKAKGIEVDGTKYPFIMSVTAKIVADNIDTDKEYMVVAESNGEYRGIAKAVKQEDDFAYFMTVYGTNKETINFKVITDDETFAIKNTLSFSKNQFVGNIENRYPLRVSNSSQSGINGSILTIDNNPVGEIATIHMQPITTDNYVLNLVSLNGTEIATLFSGKLQENERTSVILDRSNDSRLNKIPNGIYLCHLKNSNSSTVLKLIFK